MNRDAIVGGVLWCSLLVTAEAGGLALEWIDLLFLFAPLVVVPLGLELTRRVEQAGLPPRPERIARLVQLPCALAATISFCVSPGFVSAGLALVWLLFCATLALGGVIRLRCGACRKVDSALPGAAFLYLPVGAAWLCASRLGLKPLGFEEPVVLLTAVHFHYAGFAAPLLARSSIRALGPWRAPSLSAALVRALAGGVALGPALLAAGFLLGPRVNLVAAVILVASEIGLALSFLVAIRHVSQPQARCLVGVAAAAAVFAMVLAALWAVGEYPLEPFLQLAEMARFHGTANAFGFTLCGLVGWSLAVPVEADRRGCR
ncbi:MAG TPA: YndJ family transporter [Candidatus Cybelea sp.]|nr:YndJ family transporter [Candidatus Cybelea sp.]